MRLRGPFHIPAARRGHRTQREAGPFGVPPLSSPGRRGFEEPARLPATPTGSNDTAASQISHVIYRGHFSRHPTNVAIPTMQIQCLNKSQGNYVRNWWAAVGPGRTTSRRAQPPVNTPGPTGVEGAGGICRGAGGRRRGPAGLRDDAPSHTSAPRPHWCGGRRRDRRARAGFEARRRTK